MTKRRETKTHEHLEDITPYVPAGHGGTLNRRLIDRDERQGYEMVLGRIEPGGIAEKHAHAREFQAMYVVAGRASVSLGDGPMKTFEAGTIFRIPPGLEHHVVNEGEQTLELILVYSPPISRDHS